MKGEKFLKITGIIMIVAGAISIIVGILALVGVAALAELLEEASGILYLASALVLISAIVELIAGILGVKNCAKPEKAGTCIVMGVIVAVLCLVGQIINVANGSSFDILSIILGVALPVLYIIGAVMNKKELSK